MKRHLLVLLAIALAACSAATPEPTVTPSPMSTITAAPSETATPEPTEEPTRPTAFKVSLSDIDQYLWSINFENAGNLPCTLDTPAWTQCEDYYYTYKGEVAQAVEVMRDGETVVGVMFVFTDLAEKYPDEETLSAGSLQLALRFDLPTAPLILFKDRLREGDFYFFRIDGSNLSSHVWLDYRFADEIFD